MPDITLINIIFSITAVALLFVGLIGEIKYAKLPESKVLKTLWLLIILMVMIFIFGFSSLAATLVMKYMGITVRPDIINNIVAFTFLTGGVWMSSMIMLEYRVVQSAEEKSGEEKMLAQVEKTKKLLEEAMAKRMADFEKQNMEMKKNYEVLLQKETEMAEIKKEIAELEEKEKNTIS